MIALKLEDLSLRFDQQVPSTIDHTLIVKTTDASFNCPEFYSDFGLITMLEGTALLKINGHRTTIDPKSFVVLNRGSRLSLKIAEAGLLAILYFNVDLSKILSKTLLLKNPNTYGRGNDIDDYSLIEHIHYMNVSLKDQMKLLIDLKDSCSSFNALKSDMIVRSILDTLVHENFDAQNRSGRLEVAKKTTKVELIKKLALAKQWMDNQYQSDIDLPQLAGIAMLDPYHFIRMFKKAYGITPRQYIVQLRLERAKFLLKNSDLKVADICHQIGFSSVPSFTHLFKRQFERTPAAFRIRH